jgi:NTE family protein
MKNENLIPGQIVLVLQGGGALGAYQAGVYEALCDGGIEPDWVIGTSIGAINAAIIAGNPREARVARLREFWKRVEQNGPFASFNTFTRGIAAFFVPRALSWNSLQTRVGLDAASYYSTEPLRATLAGLVDLDKLNAGAPRLTVGAVNVRTSEMRYFDSREERLTLEHVMASGALPPAFPAVRIAGEPYWDGGVYSNTQIEAVLDDKPRRDSVIFSVNVWQPTGAEPESIWQVLGRQKDIQYASRADSHIARQKQIHHLRHVIRELAKNLPPEKQDSAEFRELAAWGCGTTMHIVRLLAPALDSEDYFKDIDFSPAGIRARWQAGFADTQRMIAREPWHAVVDPMEGVIVHELSARAGMHIEEAA